MTMQLSAMVRYLIAYLLRSGFEVVEIYDEDTEWATFKQKHIDVPVANREYQDFDKWCDSNLAPVGQALRKAIPKKVQHTVALPMPDPAKVIQSARHSFDGVSLRGILSERLVDDSDGIARPVRFARFDIAYREAA